MYILGSAWSYPFLTFSKYDFAWTVLGLALLVGGETSVLRWTFTFCGCES